MSPHSKRIVTKSFKRFLYFADLLMTNVATSLSARVRRVTNPEDPRQCSR
jgi:hypothetical protein